MDVTRQFGEGTLALTIPEGYGDCPERETVGQPLVAAVTEWTDAESLAPDITVQVAEPTPELVTIEQLSAATVAGQIALGRHVAAVDVWEAADGGCGRRVEAISVNPAGTTTVHLHYLSIRAGRCVTVSLRQYAARYEIARDLFKLLAASLRLVVPEVGGESDPAACPAVDPSTAHLAAHEQLEDLTHIRARQPYASRAHRLDLGDVKALGGGRIVLGRGRHHQALTEAGFLTEHGRLTDAGRLARKLLVESAVEVYVEVTEPGVAGLRRLLIRAAGDDALIQPDAWPWEPAAADGRRAVELIPANAMAVWLARWIGLSPAWTFGIHPPGSEEPTVTVPRALWDARMRDPRTPPPLEVSDRFVDVWRQPWRLMQIRSFVVENQHTSVLMTAALGNFAISGRPGGMVAVRPYPSMSLTGLLLTYSGAFEPPATDASGGSGGNGVSQGSDAPRALRPSADGSRLR